MVLHAQHPKNVDNHANSNNPYPKISRAQFLPQINPLWFTTQRWCRSASCTLHALYGCVRLAAPQGLGFAVQPSKVGQSGSLRNLSWCSLPVRDPDSTCFVTHDLNVLITFPMLVGQNYISQLWTCIPIMTLSHPRRLWQSQLNRQVRPWWRCQTATARRRSHLGWYWGINLFRNLSVCLHVRPTKPQEFGQTKLVEQTVVQNVLGYRWRNSSQHQYLDMRIWCTRTGTLERLPSSKLT